MIRLVSDTIDQSDLKKLTAWLNLDPTPQLTKGAKTLEFESKWAHMLGTRHAVFVNSGSSAILLLLAAMKAQGVFSNNKKVAVPSLSWLTDVSSPIQLGLEPLLVDCNLEDLSVNIEHLAELFEKERPAAFILVHVLGPVPKFDEIKQLCAAFNVKLIEDVCESMCSRYQGELLGSSSFTTGSVFSTYYGHHISTIEGGLINCNSSDLNYLLLSLRSHGWDRDLPPEIQQEWRKSFGIDDFDALYTFYYPGFNFRSTDLQAYIGLDQLDKIERFSFKREENFRMYLSRIKSSMLDLRYRSGDFISNFAFPVVHTKRKEIVHALRSNNIEVRPLIAGSMAEKPFWKGPKENLPNSKLVNVFGFYLPNHQDLQEADIALVCDIVNSFN